MPTALARPWPSGPVVVSTPGVTPTSGWPGRLRMQLAEVLAARRSAGRSRSGAAARTAASSRGRWTARSGRDRASADRAGCGGRCRATARRRSRPCPSACRDGRIWRLRRRPSPARGSRWRARVGCGSRGCDGGGQGDRCADVRHDADARKELEIDGGCRRSCNKSSELCGAPCHASSSTSQGVAYNHARSARFSCDNREVDAERVSLVAGAPRVQHDGGAGSFTGDD